MKKYLLALPKVDELLRTHFKESEYAIAKPIIQDKIEDLRSQILSLESVDSKRRDVIKAQIEEDLKNLSTCIKETYLASMQNSLIPLINASGVILQTNLGRSVFSNELIAETTSLLCAYNNLEYDITKGARSSRYIHANTFLKMLFSTDYEFLIVNNNAAAVFLVLNTLACDKNLIISRGEMVEIGGGFRINEIMELTRARICEVGTSNKTRLQDYEKALLKLGLDSIDLDVKKANFKESREVPNVMLMKTHKSNFVLSGFVEEVGIKELCELSSACGVPLYYDMGSGYFRFKDLQLDEPSLQDIFTFRPSIFSFSADKLFGGPQAGIIAGEKHFIEQIKQNQLLRAFRVDKVSLALLQATLKFYLHGEYEKIPTLQMLCVDEATLFARAKKLCEDLNNLHKNVSFEVIALESLAGGGSLPSSTFKSYGVGVRDCARGAKELQERLRIDFHIIARIYKDVLVCDVRTLFDRDFEAIIYAFKELLD